MFEVKFLRAIDVVESVSFLGMHNSVRLLSEMAPSSLAPLTLGSYVHQDVRLGGIVVMSGLVCEACYVYHPHDDLWLVPMRYILD